MSTTHCVRREGDTLIGGASSDVIRFHQDQEYAGDTL